MDGWLSANQDMLLSFAGFVIHYVFQIVICCGLLRAFGKNKWIGLVSIIFPLGFIVITAYLAFSGQPYIRQR